MSSLDTQILIAGGGPVGMSLAIDAAMRGLDVTLLEQRAPGAPPSTKCNTVAARTMEVFRRFGVADAVRASGLPDDFPTDWAMMTALNGPEIGRLRQPSRNERDLGGFPDSDWQTPEPVVRVSQIYIEPILYERMKAFPNLRVLNNTALRDLQQDGEGVTGVCDGPNQRPFEMRARFLVGADGGRSTVRKLIGVRLQGDEEIARTRSTLIRSPAVLGLFRNGPAWMSYMVGGLQGSVIAIDGRELWLVHRKVRLGADFETVDLHASLRAVLGVGPDFPYEVVHNEDWIGRRLVAERLREGNVFLAGDAAHLWVPYAGYGMNCGIADALNLSAKLSAFLKGWGGAQILDAYEEERLPITEQVSRYAAEMSRTARQGTAPQELPAGIEAETPEGARIRAEFGEGAVARNRPQMAPAGLNFGYYYERSPVIDYDGESAPAYTMDQSTPSTAPGCRLPHFWTAPGQSIYDLLGDDYTLIRFNPGTEVTKFLLAADAAGVPIKLLDVTRPVGGQVYAHDLLLVRLDQHVAWRGDQAPAQPEALVAKLRGAAK